MPLTLRIESELDERSASATADRAQRIYTDAAQKMSREMSEGITRGAREGGRAIEQMADKARDSYKRVGDATDELREQERQLRQMRDEGARGVEVQAERVRQARKREKEAIREAAAAYDEYERAARSAGNAGEEAGNSIMSGLRTAVGGAAGAGQGAADNFVSGFAGASALTRLASATGPIGAALVGVGALGVMAGKVLVDNIAAGMQTQATRDLFQARLGVDEATMARYGQAASAAFTNAWGASVEDNLRAVQFSVQGGVIAPTASDAEIQQSIANMQALATIMEVDVQEAARATGQLIRGGFASSGEEAADIIASGFQNGLDIAGDWLDTITEYTTQFRKLGLEGSDALGLIQQGLQGGARDSDKVADSLKEFSIRAVDGSALTAEGFAALGFQADDMAARFLAGGDSARTAFGATLTAIRSLDDPIQQALTWQALFGTQWEDMGDAINSMDLSTARAEFGGTEGAISSATATLSEHVNQWDVLGRNIDTTFTKLREWLADSAIGKFFGQDLPNFLNMPFAGYPMPSNGTSYVNPDSAPTAPVNPLDILAGGGTAPGAGSTPTPTGPGGLLLPSLTGPTPPGPPPGDAPVPGDRTPMLTDTQQQALDEATGGGSESLPPAPVLPVQYTNTAGMPTAVANAQTRLDEAAHDVAEKAARVQQLEQSNIATADDIQKAKNALLQSQQRQQQAERAMQDAQMSATEKYTNQLSSTTSTMSDLGAQLDSDFGISGGLSGMVDNFIRMIGAIAAAPLLGPLSAISQAHGDEGSGMMGILASTGAFGPQFMPNRGVTPTGAGAPGVSSAPLAGIPQSQFSDANLQPNAARLNDVIAALFPAITDIGGYRANDPYPDHPSGRALDIMIPGYDTPQGKAYGDAINQFLHANAAALGIDSTIWRQQYQPAGGAPSMMEDRGSPTQNHMDHIHALTTAGPGGSPGSVSVPIAGPVAGPAPVTSASAGGFGGFPVPLPVIIVGGLPMPISAGGAGFSPPIGTPASGQGLGPAPGPGVGPSTPPLQVPSFIPGGAAGGPLGTGFPQGLPGLGGQAYPSQGGGGGIGMGGLPMAAISSAISAGGLAIDAMAPGAGQAAAAAAQIGIQLANRAIKYAGQTAGIGVSGLLETFVPAGDNPKASIGNSWLGKIAGGIAGARPAIPNAAGGKPPGGDPAKAGAQAAGNTINNTVNQTNNYPTEDVATGSAVREMGAMHAPAGKR